MEEKKDDDEVSINSEIVEGDGESVYDKIKFKNENLVVNASFMRNSAISKPKSSDSSDGKSFNGIYII